MKSLLHRANNNSSFGLKTWFFVSSTDHVITEPWFYDLTMVLMDKMFPYE